MADPYLDYLAAREREAQDVLFSVRVSRASYEAFLEAGIPVSKSIDPEEVRGILKEESREAQPSDEPYDAGPMPAHLRRLA